MCIAMTDLPDEVTVLGGGTGTPKLLSSINAGHGPENLTVVANTGDDVEFGDLFVSPDVDACLFTVADRIDTDRWWGLRGDSTATADGIARFTEAFDLTGGPRYRPPEEQTACRDIADWRRFEPVPEFMTFGDEDRAIHRTRAAAIDRGQSLTAITRKLGVELRSRAAVLPMSDEPVATLIHTPSGPLHFQEYWVDRRGAVEVTAVEFRGIDRATPTDAVRHALKADVVVIGPSNPVTSIGPIVGLSGVQQLLEDVPVVAVSPFVGDDAFSGPAIDLQRATAGAIGVSGLIEQAPYIDAVVVDTADTTRIDRPTVSTDIRIDTPGDAHRVWGAVGEAIDRLP